ncbi:uracil phosphoribosyltransferase, partial [gut metagenome]
MNSTDISLMRTDPRFPTLHIVNHPLIEHKLSIMRDKNTVTKDFRTLLYEITLLMGYEVTRGMETELVDIETPICPMKAPMLKATNTVIVPILRAGLGMTDGLLALL